jgi:hypothetical protein
MLQTQENSQLDLFQGVLLSTEQEQEIATWIERQAKNAVNRQDEVNRVMLMLDRAGFIQNQDYKCNFEVFEVTGEREFGYSHNNTNFEKEVTYMNAGGGVSLITNCIYEGKMKKYNASVDRDGDKLMCTSVTEQYRYYKPSSLLVKFNEHNERKVNELDRIGKEKIAVAKIITKYKKLYPEADVVVGTDYYRSSYQSFPIVKVGFKSGSSVSFQLGYGDKMENERLHKYYDAVSESTEDLMERYNNQKSK